MTDLDVRLVPVVDLPIRRDIPTRPGQLFPEIGLEWPTVLLYAVAGALGEEGAEVWQVCAAVRRAIPALTTAMRIRLAHLINERIETQGVGGYPEVEEWVRTATQLFPTAPTGGV